MSTLDSRGTAIVRPDAGLVLATSPQLLTDFVAQRVLPTYEVQVAHGAMPIHVGDRRVYSTKRAPDGSFLRIFTEVKGDTFTCAEAGVEIPLYDADVKVYADRGAAEAHKAMQAARSLLIAREVAAASMLFSTALFDAAHRVDIAGAAEWDTAAGKALDNLENAIGNVEDRGFDRSALALVIPAKTLRALSRNAQVIAQARGIPAYANLGADAIPATMPGSVLAALLGIREVIVAKGVKDTSNRAKTPVFAPIWDADKCLIAHISAVENPDSALGHTFVSAQGMDRSVLSAAGDVSADPTLAFLVDSYRDEPRTADIIRAREQIDQKVTNVDAGCLVTNCLA